MITLATLNAPESLDTSPRTDGLDGVPPKPFQLGNTRISLFVSLLNATQNSNMLPHLPLFIALERGGHHAVSKLQCGKYV
jgi:hypothetical protein